jgi:hypothetical protein
LYIVKCCTDSTEFESLITLTKMIPVKIKNNGSVLYNMELYCLMEIPYTKFKIHFYHFSVPENKQSPYGGKLACSRRSFTWTDLTFSRLIFLEFRNLNSKRAQ